MDGCNRRTSTLGFGHSNKNNSFDRVETYSEKHCCVGLFQLCGTTYPERKSSLVTHGLKMGSQEDWQLPSLPRPRPSKSVEIQPVGLFLVVVRGTNVTPVGEFWYKYILYTFDILVYSHPLIYCKDWILLGETFAYSATATRSKRCVNLSWQNIGFFQGKSVLEYLVGAFFPPIWEIWCSTWIISPSMGEHEK